MLKGGGMGAYNNYHLERGLEVGRTITKLNNEGDTVTAVLRRKR